MNFRNYDLALITEEKQRQYFLGFHSTAGYVMLTQKGTTFVVDSRYIFAARKALEPKGIEVILGAGFEPLKKKAEELGVKTIGIDFTNTTVAMYDYLKESTGYEYVDVSREIVEQMAIKTEEELGYIKKACQIAEKAWLDVIPLIKEGITERELANELEYRFKKFGASGKSFDTIIGFGKNAAVPHHETGDTKLKKNQCVLMDFGCLYKGYCSDMTRTLFYGEPDEKFLKAYLATLTAHVKCAEGIVEGMTGKEADAIARDHLTSLGYGKYFTHSLGHGIGVNIHEFPTLSVKGEAKLENNMVFSNEPGVYFDGKFGIRIEDSAYMSNGKYVSFMKDDKSLVVINDGKITRKKLIR